MAGETAHFELRKREPTPAVRPFDVPPRLKPMLDRACTALAEPFRGYRRGYCHRAGSLRARTDGRLA